MKRLGMLVAICVVGVIGCGKPPGASLPATTSEKSEHEGWWCAEHGIPEADCIKCNAKMKAACKAKGGWCDKHDMAKEQCFQCDPQLKEKFAAIYRAKIGSEPPAPTDN